MKRILIISLFLGYLLLDYFLKLKDIYIIGAWPHGLIIGTFAFIFAADYQIEKENAEAKKTDEDRLNEQKERNVFLRCCLLGVIFIFLFIIFGYYSMR